MPSSSCSLTAGRIPPKASLGLEEKKSVDPEIVNAGLSVKKKKKVSNIEDLLKLCLTRAHVLMSFGLEQQEMALCLCVSTGG